MDTDKNADGKAQGIRSKPCAAVSIRGSQPSACAAKAVVADESTGLPGLRSWRGVYWVVFGCFVLWVCLLVLLARAFA